VSALAAAAAGSVRRRGARAVGMGQSQRQRLVAAMAEVAGERGRRGATVELVCERARMSRRTFYELFTDAEQCFVAAVGQSFERLLYAVDEAVDGAGSRWEERAAAAILALLETLDHDPAIARLCLIEPHAGSPVALGLRNGAVHRVARVVAEGAAFQDDAMRDVAARGAVGAVLQLAADRLLEEPGRPLRDLAGPAIYTTIAPFAGRRTAAQLAERVPQRPTPPRDLRPVASTATAAQHLLMTELTRLTLLHLERHPEACNIDIARAIGVRHESQMSRHLRRLERAGIVSHRRHGRTNAWELTPLGREAADAVRHRNELSDAQQG
jgi:AcrR family transcriptional regulator